LDIVERERLADNAGAVGAHLIGLLRERLGEHPLVGEIRGQGLLVAIEFVADRARRRRLDPALKVGARIAKAALDRGLIVRAMPHGDILGFAPPLVCSRADAERIAALAKWPTRWRVKALLWAERLRLQKTCLELQPPANQAV
jgi:L-2,4-diaminobutyrate transaminase